ncbi:MAG: leucine-rich repeat domain-containing protein [Clostridia bacterium]|nr:leucine-rich repeat domain-containing protein [Clostridia bacterium]
MKKLIFLFTLMSALAAAVFMLACCSTADAPPQTDATPNALTVTFVRENQIVYSAETRYGGRAEKPQGIPDENFIIWLFNGAEYDFGLPVTENIVLTASLTKTYEISFVADGVLLKKDSYSYNTESLDEPPIPQKSGYTAEWEKYELTGGNITVNAIYSPVIYFVRYFYGGTLVHECNCTIENIYENEPPAEHKRGYEAVWEYSFEGNACTARLKYELIKYTVNFVVGGEIIKTLTATVLDEGTNPPLPEIPEREHYSAQWQMVKAEGAAVEFSPAYTPITYKVEFYDGNDKICVQTYDVENTAIYEPPAPRREHYVCEWESYSLDGGDKKVNLLITPVVYTVSFYANGALIGEVRYTVENCEIIPPPVPEVAGAYGRWENFTAQGGDFTVNAVYSYVEGTAGLLYERNGEGYTLYGYAGNESSVTVPTHYNGEKITRIAAEAFSPYSQNYTCALEEVYMYGSVHTIEKNAFLSCDKLKVIRFPDGLETIGEGAFMGCTALQKVILPDGVSEIGESAFAGSGMYELKLPENLNEINKYVFQSCVNLTEVIIPDGAEYIAPYSFANCTALERLVFGKGMKIIDANAFYNVTTVTYAEFKAPEGWTLYSAVTFSDVSEQFSSPEAAAEIIMNYQWNEDVYYKKTDGENPVRRSQTLIYALITALFAVKI